MKPHVLTGWQPNMRMHLPERRVRVLVLGRQPGAVLQVMRGTLGGIPIDRAILERWFAGEAVAGVLFGLNDPVVVPPGDIHGDRAVVISLESVAPDVTYLVERTDGSGMVLKQDELSLLLYLPMLDEGTDVWRPVAAKRLGLSVAQVQSNCPDDEKWYFPQGARVVFEEQQLAGGSRLVATRDASDVAIG